MEETVLLSFLRTNIHFSREVTPSSYTKQVAATCGNEFAIGKTKQSWTPILLTFNLIYESLPYLFVYLFSYFVLKRNRQDIHNSFLVVEIAFYYMVLCCYFS